MSSTFLSAVRTLKEARLYERKKEGTSNYTISLFDDAIGIEFALNQSIARLNELHRPDKPCRTKQLTVMEETSYVRVS